MFATEGARPRIMRSPTRKTEAVMTRSQAAKTGKATEETSDTAIPGKNDMLLQILAEFKRHVEASSSIMNELVRKVDMFEKQKEVNRRIDRLETQEKKSIRERRRIEAGLAEDDSPEYVDDFPSRTVRKEVPALEERDREASHDEARSEIGLAGKTSPGGR